MLDANYYLGKMLAERYHLIRVIGRGASSLVFYAEDMMTRREDGSALPVAVKVLDRDSGDYKMNSRSFHNEIRAVAAIPTNPHVVAIRDVSFHEDEHFIVMEYVSGRTLGQYLEEKGGTLPAKEIASIALQLLQALRLAHEAGVVHRDIKPENVMVERAESVGKQVDIPGGADMPFVKLADFGIALLPDEDLFAMKEKGVGTVHYISPEQASGARVDGRSDLYSLGVLMHEMATGKVPFDAQSPTGIISKHQTEMPNHVRGERAGIPAKLDEVIYTAMQKNPAARYKDAATMERELREVLAPTAPEGYGLRGQGGEDLFRATTRVSGEEMGAKRGAKTEKPAKEGASRLPLSASAKRRWIIGGAGALILALLVVGAVLLFPLLFGDKTMDITVPNLINTVYNENAVYADGISVPKDKVVMEYSDKVEAGKIIKQEPAGGIVFHDVTGVEVILTVSMGPEMVDFRIPEQYRTDFATAKAYLLGEYDYLSIMNAPVEATEAVPGVLGGTVIGARRVYPDEEISLTDGKICKTKVEKIVLVVQPTERVEIHVSTGINHDPAMVKAVLEQNYPFLTVTGQVMVPSVYPMGTVLGIRLADGTEIRLSGDSIPKKATTAVLILSDETLAGT